MSFIYKIIKIADIINSHWQGGLNVLSQWNKTNLSLLIENK